MGFFDNIVVGIKNVSTREVKLYPKGDALFSLTITEYGKDRTRTLTVDDVEFLQECLWNKRYVSNGLVLSFYPNPNEIYQRFEVPHWAMERLRDDMLNERIHLNLVV